VSNIDAKVTIDIQLFGIEHDGRRAEGPVPRKDRFSLLFTVWTPAWSARISHTKPIMYNQARQGTMP
jgi:hypothetical protein